ncbi:MAG TPA: helicase-related protein [Gammaproteobacteria bacterium]|nr:helicase-related protein [Gammaproteobacteria bacterium]
MSSSVVRQDPATISTSLKEAVVDALLNLTFSRISGHGPEGAVLFGSRPRAALASGFLLPPLKEEGTGDEVTQPIRITAHGLDLQTYRNQKGSIIVTPHLQIYVRVLPSAEDISKRSDCAPRFRLNDDVRKQLITRKAEARKIRWGKESAGTQYAYPAEHPNWKDIEKSISEQVHAEMGLPLDITTLFAAEADGSQIPADGSGAEEGVIVGSAEQSPIDDKLFKPMDVPHKWVRVPIDQENIPTLVFDPSLPSAVIAGTAEKASNDLNVFLASTLMKWAESEDGKNWCFRKDLTIRYSQYRNWQKFLEIVRTDNTKSLVLPEIAMTWDVRCLLDWSNDNRTNVHISLENKSHEPARKIDTVEQSVFQVHLDVQVPNAIHAPLKLGRVKASYRYNQYLEYPALGFNGGIVQVSTSRPDVVRLKTTWAPRYTQPRVIPKSYPGIEPGMRQLSKPEGLAVVLPLALALESWFASLDGKIDVAAGLEKSDRIGIEREKKGFAEDKLGWRREIGAVKAGLEILEESKQVWDIAAKRGNQPDERACVFEAWLAMNEAMADLMKDKLKSDTGSWRLFQIAFVIAHIPTMASRIKSFKEKFDRNRDDTVTLLYFATGGGKSEAFFGLLVFILLLDRLRGKHIGVSAMLRYPLRLLTIQQAQRCAKVLAKAERVRRKYSISGKMFSIGFWVGSGGSPNRHNSPGVSDIPDITSVPADGESEAKLLLRSINYKLLKDAWDKIPACPFCGSPTVLRRFTSEGGTVAHVCVNAACDSNIGKWQPLPFYICDADIYDFAPSVLLGTVDKLALIGQSSQTLRRIYSMFGAAIWREISTGRLKIPAEGRALGGDIDAQGYERLFPAYPNGKRLFYDPFPSLVIQDEAHLLDESLGTFAGLFESTLDAILAELSIPLHELISLEPDGKTRRRAKIIAASATVSDPDRQLEHLYLRPVPAMQFPYPGEKLYDSFYAGPADPPANEQVRRSLGNVEERSQWGRVYAAFMTNGRAHTTTTVAVLSNFHTIISELLLSLTGDDPARAERAQLSLSDALSPSGLHGFYRETILRASHSDLATLVDLHRIALTYVTNKKGGDQIMAAEFEETRKRHAERKLPITDLRTELITGSVSQGDIQKTVEEAQARPRPGEALPDLATSLRSVIATSAISHGVDVEELNSMFFAGMPSDIAEYIQASSRVGRSHVGFVVLIPTPQRRRDRYIVEVFDSYHRFLERMVSPAAIDRWAGRAIERVLPSVIQTYLAGVAYVDAIYTALADGRQQVTELTWIPNVVNRYVRQNTREPFVNGLCSFVEKALGLQSENAAPGARKHYQELVRSRIEATLTEWSRDMLGEQRSLFDYFKAQQSALKRPMTSLRDVDEAGAIYFGRRDLVSRRSIDDDTARRVMRLIRRGTAEDGDLELGEI